VEHEPLIDPQIPSFSALEHVEPCPIQVTGELTSDTKIEATNIGNINTNATSLPEVTGNTAMDFITDN
jgi:hypothetical protein